MNPRAFIHRFASNQITSEPPHFGRKPLLARPEGPIPCKIKTSAPKGNLSAHPSAPSSSACASTAAFKNAAQPGMFPS